MISNFSCDARLVPPSMYTGRLSSLRTVYVDYLRGDPRLSISHATFSRVFSLTFRHRPNLLAAAAASVRLLL